VRGICWSGVVRKVAVADNQGLVICEAVLLERFVERFFGLAGKSREEADMPVILYPCSSIHTFFMRFPIDVYFVSREGRVLEKLRNLPPWRVVLPVEGSSYVIEAPSGDWEVLRKGDFLVVPELVEGRGRKRVS